MWNCCRLSFRKSIEDFFLGCRIMRHAQWRDVCQMQPKVSCYLISEFGWKGCWFYCEVCRVVVPLPVRILIGLCSCLFMAAFYCRNGSPSMCFREANGPEWTRYCGFVWRSHIGTKEYRIACLSSDFSFFLYSSQLELILPFPTFHRGDATRTDLASRVHGHLTLWYSTTHTSSEQAQWQ